MKNINILRISLVVSIALLIPCVADAQTTGTVQQLHKILENLYNEMIKLCLPLLDVARAIAGFGALFYIGYRVWKHIANAEPIDFFPLFRPFVIALLITFYPLVLSVMNGVMKPMVVSTGALVNSSNEAVEKMIEARAKSITNSEEYKELVGGLGYENNEDWKKYEQLEEEKEDEGLTLGKAVKFTLSLFANAFFFVVKIFVSFILQLLYYAAALCIDALRTFHLLILAILGPFVLCLSVFDGFQHTLPIWLARYINVYLWLPIANLFGAMIGRIQAGMLRLDTSQAEAGDMIGFGATDIAYLIFLVIAIIGYFTIPSIANYIVHASSASTLMAKVNSMTFGAGRMAVGAAMGGGAGAAAAAGSMSGDVQGSDKYIYPMADAGNSEAYVNDRAGYQHNKISGKS